MVWLIFTFDEQYLCHQRPLPLATVVPYHQRPLPLVTVVLYHQVASATGLCSALLGQGICVGVWVGMSQKKVTKPEYFLKNIGVIIKKNKIKNNF